MARFTFKMRKGLEPFLEKHSSTFECTEVLPEVPSFVHVRNEVRKYESTFVPSYLPSKVLPEINTVDRCTK